MKCLLSDIALLVDGNIIGDPSILICGIASIESAKEGDITFARNASYHKKAIETKASVILSEKEMMGVRKSFLLVANPYYAFARLLTYFHPPERRIPGIDPRAVIGQNVKIGKEVSIGACVVVEDEVQIGNGVSLFPGVFVGQKSTIGDDTKIYPNVSIYDGVKIGKRVIIHAGSVIGSDGFGFTPYPQGTLPQSGHFKIPQVGGVIIEDDVELGANVTVDRATLGNTVIGCGTKVDNQVQIGHNVTIGPHTLLVAQVGISGSVTIGHHVILAGQVGVSDHVQIGNNVVVGARSVVTNTIKDNDKVIGFPPLPYQKGLAVLSSLEHLPEMRKELKRMKIKQNIQKDVIKGT
jgi:UDP-3-O-[3-hydroxymyristoyl] glucosamine N-acyltransferase